MTKDNLQKRVFIRAEVVQSAREIDGTPRELLTRWGGFINYDFVKLWEAYVGDYSIEIGRLMRLNGELSVYAKLITQGAIRITALRDIQGQFGAAWLRVYDILTQFNLPDTVPPYCDIKAICKTRENLISAALNGNLEILREVIAQVDLPYQQFMMGTDHIIRAGRQRDAAWDWIIKTGETFRDGRRLEYERDIIPHLLNAAEILDQDDDLTIVIMNELISALETGENLTNFKDRYKKARSRRVKRGGT
jgi:hypothetical protein